MSSPCAQDEGHHEAKYTTAWLVWSGSFLHLFSHVPRMKLWSATHLVYAPSKGHNQYRYHLRKALTAAGDEWMCLWIACMGMHSLGDRLNQCSVHFGIINPKKKFILNPETMEYFSSFDKSWPKRNLWPFGWPCFFFSCPSWSATRHSKNVLVHFWHV